MIKENIISSLNELQFTKAVSQVSSEQLQTLLENDKDFFDEVSLKVQDFFKQYLEEYRNTAYRQSEIIKFPILCEMLSSENRGWIWFIEMRHHHLLEAYHLPQPIEFSSYLSSSMNLIMREEINRTKESSEHLLVDYATWFDDMFKPVLTDEQFLSSKYVQFINFLVEGLKIQEFLYKQEMGMLAPDSEEIFSSIQLANSKQLINQFKKDLFFDNWSDNLKEKFFNDLKSERNARPLYLNEFEHLCSRFAPYAKEIQKIISSVTYKNHLEKELEISQHICNVISKL